MEYFGRKPFVMNSLQTVAARKHLKGRSLRAGKGGTPTLGQESEGEERAYFIRLKRLALPRAFITLNKA
jgi:hypothetical protein